MLLCIDDILLCKLHLNILLYKLLLQRIPPKKETLTNTQSSSSSTSPSRIYTYDDFFESLRSLSIGGIYGNSYHMETNPYTSTPEDNTNNRPSDEHILHPSNHAFYISQSDPDSQNALLYGIVNICAFLANAMVESIQYDSCEEFNGMPTGGYPSHGDNLVFTELNAVHARYFPMSNACGQFGKLYSNEDGNTCLATQDDGFTNTTDDRVDMSCPIDASLEMEAAIHPRYNYPNTKQQPLQGGPSRKYGPPPFYCGSNYGRFSGYWDGYLQEFVGDVAYPSSLGKTNVEG